MSAKIELFTVDRLRYAAMDSLAFAHDEDVADRIGGLPEPQLLHVVDLVFEAAGVADLVRRAEESKS